MKNLIFIMCTIIFFGACKKESLIPETNNSKGFPTVELEAPIQEVSKQNLSLLEQINIQRTQGVSCQIEKQVEPADPLNSNSKLENIALQLLGDIGRQENQEVDWLRLFDLIDEEGFEGDVESVILFEVSDKSNILEGLVANEFDCQALLSRESDEIGIAQYGNISLILLGKSSPMTNISLASK